MVNMKNILHKSIIVAGVAFFSLAAAADMMYFMLDDDLQRVYGSSGFVTVTGLKNGDENQTGPFDLYGGGNTAMGNAISTASPEPAYADLLSEYTDYTKILFNLYTIDENNPTYQWSRAYSIDQIGSGSFVSGTSASGGTPFTVGSVPEPTGGMLMLFGMVVLAMRRKTMMV